MRKSIYGVFIGGNVGGGNLITSTNYDYDDKTFEFLGTSSLYDGGGKKELIPLEEGKVS